MNNFIGIDVVGEDVIAKKLAALPRAVQDIAVVEANNYIVNIMREYDSYKHIWRSRAFTNLRFTTPSGKVKIGYASWKQFKKVHAMAAEGKFPYQRTQTMRRGWKTVGAGRNQIVVNEVDYAGFVMGENTQDRLHKKMGWKPMEARIKQRMAKILDKFDAGVKKAIRKVGLA